MAGWGEKEHAVNAGQEFHTALADNPSVTQSNGEYLRIHKDHLEPDPEQPRIHKQQADIDERQRQMEEQGQLEAITVTRPEAEGGKWRIVNGETRWRAALQSEKIEYLDAKLFNGDPNDKLGILIAQLCTNDVGSAPLTLYEKAVAYERIVSMMKEQGSSQPAGDAAKKLGISNGHLSELLKLTKTPENIKSFILNNGIKDQRIISGVIKISEQGSDEKVKEAMQAITDTIKVGGNLRDTVSGFIQELKAEKKSKDGKTNNEKPKTILKKAARYSNVSLKPDGSAHLVIGTRQQGFEFVIDKDLRERIIKQLQGYNELAPSEEGGADGVHKI